MHGWGFELGAPLVRWSRTALLSISPLNIVAANEYKSSTRATEITRKISKHHLPDISAISREERKARREKNPSQESTRHSERREDHPG